MLVKGFGNSVHTISFFVSASATSAVDARCVRLFTGIGIVLGKHLHANLIPVIHCLSPGCALCVRGTKL